MMTKRQLVLYGAAAILLIVIAIVLIFSGSEKVSDTSTMATSTRPFEPIATTSNVRSEPSPSQAAAPAPAPFRFEIVTDRALQAKGLSGRADIPQNYGMLFVSKEKAAQRFWMKDMLAPIDIIWINDASVVLKVDANISPATYRGPNDADVFVSPEPVRYVLETRAGEAARLGIAPGTKVNLPLPYGE
jgi:hypothetical protein